MNTCRWRSCNKKAVTSNLYSYTSIRQKSLSPSINSQTWRYSPLPCELIGGRKQWFFISQTVNGGPNMAPVTISTTEPFQGELRPQRRRGGCLLNVLLSTTRNNLKLTQPTPIIWIMCMLRSKVTDDAQYSGTLRMVVLCYLTDPTLSCRGTFAHDKANEHIGQATNMATHTCSCSSETPCCSTFLISMSTP